MLELPEIPYPKPIVGTAIALMVLYEARKGYFKNFSAYLKNLDPKPYRILLLIFFPLFWLAFLNDRFLLDQVQGLKGLFWEQALGVGRTVGENVRFWAILIIFYWSARLLKWKKAAEAGFGAILSSGLAGISAHLCKMLFMRTRPTDSLSPYSFFHYYDLLDNPKAHQSLPSGDVALVSAAAVFFFLSIRNRALGVLILLVPFANAYARMSLNRHWPSDTLLAAALGIMAACFFFGLNLSTGTTSYTVKKEVSRP